MRVEIPQMEVEVIKLNAVFPNLAAEMAKRGIKKCAVSSALGISGRALYNKMSGNVPFTWPETCVIKDTFFPDMDKDDLFSIVFFLYLPRKWLHSFSQDSPQTRMT